MIIAPEDDESSDEVPRSKSDCSVVQQGAYTILDYTILYYSILYCTILYYTIL